MKKVATLLGVLLCASIAQAQPDDGPGMGKVEPAIPMQEQVMPVSIGPREGFQRWNNPSGKMDLSSPEATVRSFIWAFTNADFKTARQCVENALPHEKLLVIEQQAQQNLQNPDGILITDLHSYPAGEDAVVTLRALTLPVGKFNFFPDAGPVPAPPYGSCERFHLKRVEGNWLISSNAQITKQVGFLKMGVVFPTTQNAKSSPILNAADDVLVTWAALFADAEMVTEMNALTHQSQCQMNLKHLGLAILQFAQDFNETFPLADDWQNQLAPYIRDEQILHCPILKENEAGYSYNPEFDNTRMANIDAPTKTILMYEGSNQKFEFRHQIGEEKFTNILFADGHVKAFSKKTLEEALKDESVRWTP